MQKINLEEIPGVGKKIAEKLREVGFTDPMVIAVASPAELASIAEIGEGQATKIINYIRKQLQIGFESADKIYERKLNALRISTGSKNLDRLLGGGVESLPPNEKILILNSGSLNRVEIGDLVDESLSFGKDKTNGITEISTNNVRDAYSISFDENFKIMPIKITAFVRHKRIHDVFEVKLSRGRKIRVTSDHSIFVLRNGKLIALPLSEVKKDDFCAVPRKIPVIRKNIKNLNLLNFVLKLNDKYLKGLYIKDKEFVDVLINKYASELKSIAVELGYKERKIYDWKYGKRMPLVTLKRLKNIDKLIKKFRPKFGSKTLVNSDIKITKDLCWFLGFSIAKSSMNENKPYFAIYEEISRENLLEKAKGVVKDTFGINISINQFRTNSRKKALVTGNTALWVAFKSLGISRCSHKKRVPNFIFHLPKEHIIAFLKGFFDGDKRVKRETIGWCTTSKELMEDISLLLMELDEIPIINMYVDRWEKSYKQIFYIFAFKLKDIELLGKKIKRRIDYDILPVRDLIIELIRKHNLTNKLKKIYDLVYKGQPTFKTVKKFIKQFSKYKRCEDIKDIKKLINSDLRFEKIVSVKKCKKQPEYVYDIQVLNNPEIDNFIAGTYAFAHNTQAITETYAQFGCGKSQLAFQLAVNVQLPPERGGLGRGCIFIDSENTFSPTRIETMAKAINLDPQQALKNIFVSRAFNSEHQISLVENAKELIEEKNIGLIVVDSLTSHFRADYLGRGELAVRQQKLNRHLHVLQRYADAYNLAVYVTNQVMARPDVLFGDPTAPVGGNVLAHMSTYRIYLRKGKSGTRIARMVDAPNLPESEVVFKITEDGIRDVD